MKPCRLSIAAIGLQHLTSLRGISSWLWRRMTLREPLIEPDRQASMSLLACLLDYQMQAVAFFCLMEQCLGDQQTVTLLLYLDDICIFAPSIEVMSDQIELVFNRLKEYYLKIKVISWTPMFCFWPYSIIKRNICKP